MMGGLKEVKRPMSKIYDVAVIGSATEDRALQRDAALRPGLRLYS